jgi:hypothetical protein
MTEPTETTATENIPVENAIVPVTQLEYVKVEKSQLNDLINRNRQAETENQQFKQDLVNLAGLIGYVFQSVQKADGLTKLIPIKKITVALMQGKMPEFSGEEIQKLLLKAKSKVFADPNMSIAINELVAIGNRYTPIFGVNPLPTDTINALIND